MSTFLSPCSYFQYTSITLSVSLPFAVLAHYSSEYRTLGSTLRPARVASLAEPLIGSDSHGMTSVIFLCDLYITSSLIIRMRMCGSKDEAG